MKNDYTEDEIIVRPTDGMQLSVGYIRKDSLKVIGCLPGLDPYSGKTVEDVRIHLEQEAKEYYGDDVIVEIAGSHAKAS